MTEPYRTLDPATLPKHFDAAAAEQTCDARWVENRLHAYDPLRPRAETFVVDTPPPTVSGALHIGHVFSYTHADVIVRHQRMRGLNIFYPMGWDDNGLPTERRVQNHYHVRCDPTLVYESDLQVQPASAKERKSRPRMISRPNFIELCHALTAEDEKLYMALWRRLGLSVDWTQEYATIGALARTTAQRSFLDLFEKGWLYSSDAPTQWDVDFQTAVAQAELEDRDVSSTFNDIAFTVEGSDEEVVIATTRPELLPACVAITAHPDDARYRHLFGKRAISPLFRMPVPIFASDKAEPDKGTGILMICTFGDATDVQWWKEEDLPLRQIIGRKGRLLPVTFGEPGWESHSCATAAQYYAELVGKRPEQARAVILEQLARPDAAVPDAQPALRGTRSIVHAVKFFEKGDRPLEFVPTRQWFCRLMDKKEQLLRQGEKVRWHPSYMGARYRSWTENLQFDWAISRQRYFGVPFPIWYRLDERGVPNFETPLIAEAGRLPVDPSVDVPTGFEPSTRGEPGGFVAEMDVFDTWFTSSLSPLIASHWCQDPKRHAELFPADIRPQAHEIIRTWAFYTIVKSLAHEQSVPWSDAVISGWVVQRSAQTSKNEKISKSKGGQAKPIAPPNELLDRYTPDACRYWAASAKLGVDTAFDEKSFATGKRLVTKLFNASKFVLSQEAEVGPVQCELDLGFLAALRELTTFSEEAFGRFEFASALARTESFFWSKFTDSYIELCKGRARSTEDTAGRSSAVATLRQSLSILLRLFAPFLPFITDEVWSWVFADETGHRSIHGAPWPDGSSMRGLAEPSHPQSFACAVAALATINRSKTTSGVGVGRAVSRMTLAGSAEAMAAIDPVMNDVLAAGRIANVEIVIDASIEPGAFAVQDVEFEPKPVKT